jgi:uncharacterized protein (DUF924 family)
MKAQDVLHFWFEELKQKDWFAKNEKLDTEIRGRFQKVHTQARIGELFSWRSSSAGRLAEIIVLDQFSRNMFRDKAEAFASDPVALVLAQEAVRAGADKDLSVTQKSFMYMPYMHSESLIVHEEAVRLFHQPGLEYNYDYELKHKKIIERFGRFPHRNKILGRVSTAEEIEFLKQPDSSF